MFTLRLALTLLIAALAAALIAPLIAPIVASAGFHFPFPRIFDRVVMVTLAIAIWRERHELGLARRLQAGFAQPLAHLDDAAAGLLLGAAAIGVLWVVAWLNAPTGSRAQGVALLMALAGNIAAALTIAIIEEGFFRAFLLHGMAQDLGWCGGLIGSSAIYAAAHLVRSPARFELRGIHPLAGLHNLSASLAQLCHPISAAPGLFGLFLLGLLLGIGLVRTGRVYFSVGLHTSVILGAKTWHKFAPGAQSAPPWLAGYGRPPIISGAVAWLVTLALLVVVDRLTRGANAPDRTRHA
jgi:membrane protease YdiL (CAAX protease family)